MVPMTALLLVALLGAPPSFGRVDYRPPEGWRVDNSKPGVISLQRVDGDSYCLAAIYPATPAAETLDKSFSREWQNIAARTLDPIAEPAHTLGNLGASRGAMGGTLGAIRGTPTPVMFFVVDGGALVVPIITLFSGKEALAACQGDLAQLLGSVVVGKRLATSDLAGEWKHNDRITTNYVDRDTGANAGTDNLSYGESWSITAEGQVSSTSHVIRNGKKIVEKLTGTIAVDGAVLEVRLNQRERYVIRGWQDSGDATVLVICGPFYGDDDADLRVHLENPEKGQNLHRTWVRRR